jgi:carbon monoxide dehydrogenase subunit G
MKLEQSFEVDAPIGQVWTALIDLEKVAPCLPGAAITGHDDGGTYHGEFKVKLGPTTASYRGTIKIESADAAAHTATLVARGTDKRGQGGANATIVNRLSEREGGGTRVDAETDFTITGRLASFGRGGMMQDISNRLLRDFATCLQQRLATEPAGGMTGEEAAASAGASTEGAEASAAATAEGKSPAEVSGERATEAAEGKAPAEVPPPGTVATPPQAAPPPTAARGPAPPPAAAPVKGLSLLFSVLWERIRNLLRRLFRRRR